MAMISINVLLVVVGLRSINWISNTGNMESMCAYFYVNLARPECHRIPGLDFTILCKPLYIGSFKPITSLHFYKQGRPWPDSSF